MLSKLFQECFPKLQARMAQQHGVGGAPPPSPLPPQLAKYRLPLKGTPRLYFASWGGRGEGGEVGDWPQNSGHFAFLPRAEV